MAKGIDTGKTFLQGVLSKITDPELKAAAEKAFNDPVVMTEVGNGVEGQSEIDRQLQTLRNQQDEIEAEKDRLQKVNEAQVGWYTTNKAALEEYKTLKTAGTGGKVDPSGKPAAATSGVTKDDLTTTLQEERAAFLGYQRDQNKLQLEHFNRFKEMLDIEPLLQHPQIGTLGLIGVYNEVNKTRLTQHAEGVRKAEEDRIRADEREKLRAETANLPYPLPTGVGSGSPLDALTGTGKADSLVEKATQEYARLTAARDARA